MQKRPEKATYPPGPRPGWFGFSILADFRKDPLEQLDRLHREYGDAVSYRVGPYRQYLFFHPHQVRELLVSKAKSFQGRFRRRGVDPSLAFVNRARSGWTVRRAHRRRRHGVRAGRRGNLRL